MFQENLAGKSVLIVEDEYLLARELADHFATAGARVIGPMPSLVFAFEALQDHRPDVAILDMRLGDDDVVPLAEHLRYMGVPFLFATAYPSSVPASFGDVTVIEKPIPLARVSRTLEELLQKRGGAKAKSNGRPKSANTLLPIDVVDQDEALRIAHTLAERTGQKVTLFDEDMIEIKVVSSPRRN